MSCLTRKLQQNLVKYLQRNKKAIECKPPEEIRENLVNEGICPSSVTTDQVKLIMNDVASG